MNIGNGMGSISHYLISQVLYLNPALLKFTEQSQISEQAQAVNETWFCHIIFNYASSYF